MWILIMPLFPLDNKIIVTLTKFTHITKLSFPFFADGCRIFHEREGYRKKSKTSFAQFHLTQVHTFCALGYFLCCKARDDD